jgi:hypothetical protein
MAYRPKGKAFVDPYAPTAFAICSRCGSLYNRDKLDWQYQWYGNKLFNKRVQVCSTCMDKPSQFLRQVILPPDPPAINQPRSEPYSIDEAGGYAPDIRYQGVPFLLGGLTPGLAPLGGTNG